MGKWVLLLTFFSFLYFLGVYTSYKPYLNRGREYHKTITEGDYLLISNLNVLTQGMQYPVRQYVQST